ncbi:CTP-dependent riboflavin kinase, partial [Candidatus Bathyarchaeota archaeon]|nr:CTP-dependent riboflavin kinase [Candidatus Bathyarchaeota archaeon]
MGRAIIQGEVFSGSGEGSKYLGLSWVRKQIKEKLGFFPYPGTLNIKVDDELKLRKMLSENQSIEILPEKGYCTAKCIMVYVGGVKCAIIIPEVDGYPGNVMEIIAPVSLREKLGLKDG